MAFERTQSVLELDIVVGGFIRSTELYHIVGEIIFSKKSGATTDLSCVQWVPMASSVQCNDFGPWSDLYVYIASALVVHSASSAFCWSELTAMYERLLPFYTSYSISVS
jgi:hypothetical protein